jgi:hypothetical protein
MTSYILRITINKNVTYFTNVYAYSKQEAYSLAKEYCNTGKVEVI